MQDGRPELRIVSVTDNQFKAAVVVLLSTIWLSLMLTGHNVLLILELLKRGGR